MACTCTKIISILLLLCLINLPVNHSQVGAPPDDYITYICLQTIDPSLCVSVLYNLPNTTQADLPRLAEIMIQQPFLKGLGVLQDIGTCIVTKVNDTVLSSYCNLCFGDFESALFRGLRPATAQIKFRRNFYSIKPLVKIATDSMTHCLRAFTEGTNVSDYRNPTFGERAYIVRDMTLIAGNMLSLLQG